MVLRNGLREIGWDLPNGKGTMFVWQEFRVDVLTVWHSVWN